MKKFVFGRIKSATYAIKGFIMLFSEDAVKFHSITCLIAVIAGFYFGINKNEWIAQFLCLGLLLVAEGANTAIEKVCDFIHPDYHEKIGEIKDVAAGTVTFASVFGGIVVIIIYLPYVVELVKTHRIL